MRSLSFVIASLLAAVVVSACGSDPHPPAADRAGITAALPTATAQEQAVEQVVRFDGVVEAISQATVAAQTRGRILTLPFDVGDAVSAGDEIVRITSAEQGAQVDAAQSGLAEALARRTEAEQAYTRAADVYARKLISKADFDRVSANRDAARAQAKSAQARLDAAREALKYTVVRAPYSGTVLERHVRLGEVVAPGTPLMTGVSLDNLRVAVNVPQSQMAELRQDPKARILLDDGTQLTPAAIRMPMAADPTTHAFRVRLELTKPPAQLLPGALVKVAFTESTTAQLVVPAAAIVRRGELTAVYVLDQQQRLRLRYIREGVRIPGDQVVVAAGLDAGEQVVLDSVAAAVAYKSQSFVTSAAEKGSADE